MTQIVRAGGDRRHPFEGIPPIPQGIEQTLDVLELGKDRLFATLEKGFKHQIASGFRYRIDVDHGRCIFTVTLPDCRMEYRGRDCGAPQSFDLTGHGIDLRERAADGVDPADIFALRRETEDASVSVPVPLAYLMAEELVKHRTEHGPDRIDLDWPIGEWMHRHGKLVSKNIYDAMKAYEIIGRMGVRIDDGGIDILLRQQLFVGTDHIGEILETGSDDKGWRENLKIDDFRKTHVGIVRFHIHEARMQGRDMIGKVPLDEVLRPSDSDEDIFRTRIPHVIFAENADGFPGRVHAFEGDALCNRGILFRREANQIFLVRNYETKFAPKPLS